MKIWFFVFMVLPLLGCFYIGWHVWRILPLANVYKIIIIVMMLACFGLLFHNFSFGLERYPLPVARVLYAIGTSSIFVMLYLVMLFLVLDLGHLFHLVPSSFLRHSAVGSLSIVGIMLALFVYGNIHYYNKVRQPLDITTDKSLDKPVKMVLISDLHLGYHNTRTDFEKWVEMINKEHADMVLIAGDIVDISLKPILEENMAEVFRQLNAPVYACLGNHDYYAGEPKSEQFIRESGIRLLRDTCVTLPNGITLIGRDDRTNMRRKSLSQLTKEADLSHFTILLDHQPYHLEEAQQCGIDFQFSGHTHNGQVWPISWIEKFMYEDVFGLLQKGKTQYYVSSGIGIWGGKFRIGTHSEYVVLSVHSL
ncbi:MAG: metallophosphoesterase [Prevotella sp.]|nr:metallophosphoesterase [Prevotella sp.]